MNIPAFPLLFLLLMLLPISCQRPFLADDDQTNAAKWEAAGVDAERQILGLHATPFEWFAISENEFFRFDANNKILEKRPLKRLSGVLGVPALSDNTFVRITTNDDAKQVIEFHLTRDGSDIWSVLSEDLKSPSDDFLSVETISTNNLGAFSNDGTLFMLPATVLPDQHYALLMFEIRQNQAHSAFVSVEMVKRTDLPELRSNPSKIKSVRFADGNFYVTTHEGAWRITPNGNKEKIFQQWMTDVFSWKGDLYITGINEFDLHKSTDNGLNWTDFNQLSDLKITTNANSLLFTQEAPGLVYRHVGDDLKKAKNIVLPADIIPQPAVYYGMVFFAGKYYMCGGKEVYWTENIVTE